jgi:hypothetical protein
MFKDIILVFIVEKLFLFMVDEQTHISWLLVITIVKYTNTEVSIDIFYKITVLNIKKWR